MNGLFSAGFAEFFKFKLKTLLFPARKIVIPIFADTAGKYYRNPFIGHYNSSNQ